MFVSYDLFSELYRYTPGALNKKDTTNNNNYEEYNLQQELLDGKEHNAPVILVTHNGEGKITNIWKTTSKEWLPQPFNPTNFGNAFVQYLKGYHEQRLSDSVPMLLHDLNG